MKNVHVQLDITPSWWGGAEKGLVATGIAAALDTKIPISEVRASNNSLLVLTEVPADDVPVVGLARRCGELRDAVEQVVRA